MSEYLNILENRASQKRLPDSSETFLFTSGSVTFNPLPYQVPQSAKNNDKSVHRPGREADRSPPKPLDPSFDDGTAVFIHPPFKEFPNAHLYPDGLTFSALVENLEWFLDPEDFRKEGDSNSNGIAYPQALEPPRGWCPTRKRDMKGKEANSNAQEPQLRCTFCRRCYAGVNAKSMWRRHVLEKHKVPMSNRRDTNEGGRGSRTLTKENKRFTTPNQSTANRLNENHHKSRNIQNDLFQPSSQPVDSSLQNTDSGDGRLRTLLPAVALSGVSSIQQPSLSVQIAVPDFSIEKTTDRSGVSQHTIPMLPPSPSRTKDQSGTTGAIQSPVPNILTTPIIKHIRDYGRLPWKFPSPSHPLHPRPEELLLGVPVRGIAGEGLQGSYIPMFSTPFTTASPRGNVKSSPSIDSSPLHSKLVTGRIHGWKRSASDLARTPLPGIPEPEPRRLFYTGPLPVPVTDRFGDETPNLTMSTDLEDLDTSFSALSDSVSAWFDINGVLGSPEKDNLQKLNDKGSPIHRASDLFLPKQAESSILSTNDMLSTSTWALQSSGVGLGITLPISSSHVKITSGADRAITSPALLSPFEETGAPLFPLELQEGTFEGHEGSSATKEVSRKRSSPTNSGPPLKRRRTVM